MSNETKNTQAGNSGMGDFQPLRPEIHMTILPSAGLFIYATPSSSYLFVATNINGDQKAPFLVRDLDTDETILNTNIPPHQTVTKEIESYPRKGLSVSGCAPLSPPGNEPLTHISLYPYGETPTSPAYG